MLLVVASVPQGARAEFSYSADLSVGHDTNPLEVASFRDGIRESWFTEVGFRSRWSRSVGNEHALYFDADARARLHEGAASDSDLIYQNLTFGFASRAYRLGNGEFFFLGGARYFATDRTYVDRATGETFQAVVDPQADPLELVEIGDRYDSAGIGAFLETRYKVTDDLMLSLTVRRDDVGYDESYDALSSLQPLDYSQTMIEPGVSYRFHPRAVASFRISSSKIEYDDLSAVDASGFLAPGISREYRMVGYNAQIFVRPSEPWSFRVRMLQSGRDDEHAGYYDGDSQRIYVSSERSFGSDARAALFVSQRSNDYDSALVVGLEDEQTLRDETTTFGLRYERGFRGNWIWFTEGRAERVDNRDPIYAHDQDVFLAGVRVFR